MCAQKCARKPARELFIPSIIIILVRKRSLLRRIFKSRLLHCLEELSGQMVHGTMSHVIASNSSLTQNQLHIRRFKNDGYEIFRNLKTYLKISW